MLQRMFAVPVVAVLLAITVAAPLASQAAPTPVSAVVVTGAGSGIGRRITERLAERGIFVYAGTRTQQERTALNAIKNVQAIQLDVTSASDIAHAVEIVSRGGHALRGIVNNAGVASVTPLIEADEKELDLVLGVNLYGPYRITKAFAPLLIESKGRVVNISSLNGIVASPMLGVYSMSKHGVEAFSDALAAELARFGVRVSMIEPGNYGTEIGKNLLARIDTAKLSASRFEPQMRSTIAAMSAFENNPPPDAVADAVYDALTSDAPKLRYLVVPVAGQATIVFRKLMEEIVQLNDQQPFSIDRDVLVKMLDDAIARSKARR